MIKLKICGYREILPRETWKWIQYVGINLVPTSRRYVTEGKITKLLLSLPKNIETVAVIRNMPLLQLIQIQEKYCFDYLQLHGDESRNYCQKLKDRGQKIIKACTHENYHTYEDYPVDFLLIDSTQPGSWVSYDYNSIQSQKSYFLAWWINSTNIQSIQKKSTLYALDIASGGETNNRLDPEKIAKIVQKIKH